MIDLHFGTDKQFLEFAMTNMFSEEKLGIQDEKKPTGHDRDKRFTFFFLHFRSISDFRS